MKHFVIGLCGYANAGKDTAADLLVARAGFRKLAFADALKAELGDAFHVEPIMFDRREFKSQLMPELALNRCLDLGYVGAAIQHLVTPGSTTNLHEELAKPRTPRETMQMWGTHYRRAGDPEYWTKIVARRMAYCARELQVTRFVVTDCRFENEVAALRALGGRIWQIRRPGLDASTTTEGQHVSATDGEQWKPDAVINNVHDLRHLQQLVLSEWWTQESGFQRVKAEITQ